MTFCVAVATMARTPVTAAAPAWPQFRGPNCAGVSEDDAPPVQFGPTTNCLWRCETGPGLSSPAVWKGRVFLTAFEKGVFETLCIRTEDGSIQWRRPAPLTKVEATDPKNSTASATPATDGERVCVYLGAYGVLAYDFEGRELWRRPLSFAKVTYGSGASPALVEGYLLINRDQEDGNSSLLALDARTGRTLWETLRPSFRSSYATPVLWKRHDAAEIVLAGTLRIAGYDLATGNQKWSAHGLEAFDVCPTPVIGKGQLYAMSYSFGGSTLPTFASLAKDMDKNGDHKLSRDEARPLFSQTGFDLTDRDRDGFVSEADWMANLALLNSGEHGLFAMRTPGTGDITATHIVWKQKRGAATVSSPIFYRDRIYVVQDGGRLTCYDPDSGNPIYEQERLGAEGAYHASPVAANGNIYLASNRGVVSVAQAGDAFKVVARNDLAEPITASPAIAADLLYLRTATRLWAFGRSSPTRGAAP